MMRVSRPPTFGGALFLLLLAAPLCRPAPALAEQEPWARFRTKSFLLVSNARERDVRRVGARLERLRELLPRLLPAGEVPHESVPITVMVFRDDASYAPFKPLYEGRPAEVDGYFQSSIYVDYITLSVGDLSAQSLDALVTHEYVHLLVKNNFRGAPLWFNEGLAEYYSTLDLTDGG